MAKAHELVITNDTNDIFFKCNCEEWFHTLKNGWNMETVEYNQNYFEIKKEWEKHTTDVAYTSKRKVHRKFNIILEQLEEKGTWGATLDLGDPKEKNYKYGLCHGNTAISAINKLFDKMSEAEIERSDIRSNEN